MIITISTYILTFMIGFISANISFGMANRIKRKKLAKNSTQEFEEVLEKIKSGKSSFFSRVNNTVIIVTETKNLSEINIVYLIDKKMVCIFRNNTCLHTSENIDRLLKENIITHINFIYKKEIEDIIELFGVVISKKELHEKFEELRNKISSGEFSIEEKEESFINKIINDAEIKNLNIDDILDRINLVGIEKLTNEEKEFLNNYNKS